jgi:hypothetical protein
MERPAYTGVGGVQGEIRRRKAIPGAIERAERVLGRPATASETADLHNESLRKRRANPGKSGALLAPSDVAEYLEA